MRSRFFQCHHSFASRFFQFGQGSLAWAKIAAQEEQYRPSARDRMPEVAKNGTMRASRVRMKIHRRMLVSCRAPVFSKMLLVIAPGWIQHRQPKIFRARCRHSNCFRLRPLALPGGLLARKLGGLVALPESRDGPRRANRTASPPLLPCRLGRVQDSARSRPFLLVAPVLLSKSALLGPAFLPMSALFRLRATPKAQASDRPLRAPNCMGRAWPGVSALSA